MLEGRCLLAAEPLGVNDFRISHMGEDGSDFGAARSPAVAYNSQDNQYLVVWAGSDLEPLATPPEGDYEEVEIYGQLLDGRTGAPVGGRIRISDMGPDGSVPFDAHQPAVVYNSVSKEYLVAAYNAAANEYLVTWQSDDDTGGLVDNEREIFGQRLNAAGNEIGPNDFRISDVGPDGDTSFSAIDPDVVYNSILNEYLVVFRGDDNFGTLVDGEFEIFGQRLNAAGNEVGPNDFRISRMGPDGDAFAHAFSPDVDYDSLSNE